ncbi:hypothetical protein [Nocardioides deserti]|uniref:ParB/Sulfiredoxin domain-containing protein n=1 Tax=Nocardioides deserti TaxID=1588644 RepID=A0ABR6UAD4_9ACTN|nr:hypothetical protein [Nocardioides deserti]MBC2961240.1 hypothetical protein [Nocardioides deserti]GGO72161.1 hypothetical protein GCM10012276_14850 [Nocardioides deserti]
MRDIGVVPLDLLLLDPMNPRIPEALQNQEQEVILQHLFDNDVLDELASSFLENGYFENEPVLVLPPDESGRRIVVEGNRRVATLIVLTQERRAAESDLRFDFFDAPPTEHAIDQLRLVPCFEIAERQEISAYLGYRHIGGLRQWPAEAKARFIATEVLDAEREGISDPFYHVGRVIGSNARGVRASYETLEILRFAQQELDFNTALVRERRFTVWGLLVSNSGIRDFIGYTGRPRSLAAVREAVSRINEDNLRFVLDDLVPGPENTKPVLSDSRSVSTYAQILEDERARETLKRYKDLDLAASLVRGATISTSIQSLIRRLEPLVLEASGGQVDHEALSQASRLRELATSLESVIEGKVVHK